MASNKQKKNARTAQKADKIPIPIPKNKLPFSLFPRKPGKPVKPCGYYATRGEAEEAQKRFAYETVIGSWK